MLDLGFHYIPVLVGGITYMLYGGIYYSIVLSEKKKAKYEGFVSNQMEGPLKYIYSVIAAFVLSFLMSVFVQSIGADTVLAGMGIGFMIGILIMLVYLKNSLFGLMSRKALYIAAGDHLVIFTVVGAVQGLLI